MKYGYFDDSKKEYIITNPKTPVKWINYIGTLNFGGFVDHTGGSLLCKGDPSLNRITKYIPQLPCSDIKGETLYIRFKNNGKYKIFSPFYTPTLDNYDLFECHIGLLYSTIISEIYGIRTEVTIFVPINGNEEIRSIKVKNISDKPLDIDIIPVVEYSHFDALKQFNNADWVPQTMQSRIYEEKNGLKTLIQYAFKNRDIQVNYFTSNYSVSSYDSDRKIFLGDNEYGSWAKPLSLLNDDLNNSQANRGDNIGALMHKLGNIKPGEEKRIIVLLGQAVNIKKAGSEIEKYRNEKNVDKALSEISNFWEEFLNKFQVKTPDESMNSMINIHNARQCYITKNWSRYLSLYQLGLGTRGIGFRDSSQDVMGIMPQKPDEAKELIEKLLYVQKIDGSAMHQFNPVTMIGTCGDADEEEDRPKYYGDDHLWIILATGAFLKETGDMDFLKKEIAFYDKGKDNKPIEKGTVLDHLKRAIEFTHDNTGEHGLPLLGFADWNDTVNLRAGAESVFIANLYGIALLEMLDILKYLKDNKTHDKYKLYYEEMKNTLNKVAWDGEWFIRYFDYDGTPVGSSSNTHGQIYTNAQSWSVMSGFAENDKAVTALESVNKKLNTKNGIKLSTPGYDGFDPGKGGVTTYPPGAKENGGIFLHSNPWVMIAETIVGNGDRAFEYYNQINPAAKNDIIDEYECEPYCYAQNILGDEHPQFGLARNSWLSGTSSWVYQAATKYILGIMPVYNGLKIDPCIPKKWDGFYVKREFRGAVYEITVENPDHVSKGIAKVYIEEKEQDNNIIPIFNDNKKHKIKVIMG